VVKSRSTADLTSMPDDQAPTLKRSGSTRSLPGGVTKQRPQSIKVPDPASDQKAHARHLKIDRPTSVREGYNAISITTYHSVNRCELFTWRTILPTCKGVVIPQDQCSLQNVS